MDNSVVLAQNNLNHEELRDLDKLKDGDKFRVFVTSMEHMMRGIDFRSRVNGVCLIANKSFSSNRALAQGMSRVGRFQDPCEREIVENVNEVDDAKIKKTAAALCKFLIAQRAEREAQEKAQGSKAAKNDATFKEPVQPANGRPSKKNDANQS